MLAQIPGNRSIVPSIKVTRHKSRVFSYLLRFGYIRGRKQRFFLQCGLCQIFFRNLLHQDMAETETPLNLIWNITSNISKLLNTSSNDSGQQDPLVKIKEMIWFISHPILIIFGTFGNVLVFIVMRRGSLKNVSTCFYMSILALADTGISTFYNFLLSTME